MHCNNCQIDIMLCSPRIYHYISILNLLCLFHDSLLLVVETYFCRLYWGTVGAHVKLGLSAVGLTASWAMTPFCVITSFSLCCEIHLSLFQLGNIPCCCEEDGGIIFSIASQLLAGMLQGKGHCQDFLNNLFVETLRYHSVLLAVHKCRIFLSPISFR